RSDVKDYSNYANPNGIGQIVAGQQMIKELENDKYGITFTGIPYKTQGVKDVPLAHEKGDPFVPLTLENVQQRKYPLIRNIYAYTHSKKPMNPAVKEFLRFILSREGQELVQQDGKYLPLTAEEIRIQLKKLEDIELVVNGQKQKTKMPPEKANGHIFVPFQAVFEKFGYNVTWDEDQSLVTAVKDSVTITFKNRDIH